jgi:hypothetical protein
MTRDPIRRFLEHSGKSGGKFPAAAFVQKFGFRDVWSMFETKSEKDAVALELQCYKRFREVYPDHCFSIGNFCACPGLGGIR